MTGAARFVRAAMIAPSLLLGLLSIAAGAAAAAERCRPPLEPWTQVELYFGRDVGGEAVVSEEAFRQFLAETVTPLFPDGLSVVDVAGQFRASEGAIVREPTKLLIILVPDAAGVAPDVETIVAAYKERFDQQTCCMPSSRSASGLGDARRAPAGWPGTAAGDFRSAKEPTRGQSVPDQAVAMAGEGRAGGPQGSFHDPACDHP
jgi:hypothetical protein